MEKAGFKVDMQPMDWQSIVIRHRGKNPPDFRRLACLPHLSPAMIHRPVSNRTFNSSATRPSMAGPAIRRWKSSAIASPRNRPGQAEEIAEAVQIRATSGRPSSSREWRLVSRRRQERLGIHAAVLRCSGVERSEHGEAERPPTARSRVVALGRSTNSPPTERKIAAQTATLVRSAAALH